MIRGYAALIFAFMLTATGLSQPVQFSSEPSDSGKAWSQNTLRRYTSLSIARQEGRTVDEQQEHSEKEMQVRFSGIVVKGAALVKGTFVLDSLVLRTSDLPVGVEDSIRKVLGVSYEVLMWQGMPLIFEDQSLPDSTKMEFLYRAVEDFYPPSALSEVLTGKTLKPGDSIRVPDSLMYVVRTTGIPVSEFPRSSLKLVKIQGEGRDAVADFELRALGKGMLENQQEFFMDVSGTLSVQVSHSLMTSMHLTHSVVLTESDTDELGNPVDLESTITLSADVRFQLQH